MTQHIPILISIQPRYSYKDVQSRVQGDEHDKLSQHVGRRLRNVIVVRQRRQRACPGSAKAVWAVPGYKAACTRRQAIVNARRGLIDVGTNIVPEPKPKPPAFVAPFRATDVRSDRGWEVVDAAGVLVNHQSSRSKARNEAKMRNDGVWS